MEYIHLVPLIFRAFWATNKLIPYCYVVTIKLLLTIFKFHGEKQCYAETFPLVGKMPTSCCVIGCSNWHSRNSGLHFYRFPKDPDRRRMWLAFVCRQNQDGTPWEPGDGDRVCSLHFLSGSKSDIPTDPDYVPSLHTGREKTTTTTSDISSSAVARFQRVQRRSMAAQTALAEAEAVKKRHKRLLSAVMYMYDHGSLARHDSERQEELIVKPPGHSELLCTSEHDYIISAEIGVFRRSCMLALIITVIIFLVECQTEEYVNEKEVDELRAKVTSLEGKMLSVAEFSVHVIENNDNRTRFYTGLPTFGVFTSLVNYLRPKASTMVP